MGAVTLPQIFLLGGMHQRCELANNTAKRCIATSEKWSAKFGTVTKASNLTTGERAVAIIELHK
jgi:hypothetical protein